MSKVRVLCFSVSVDGYGAGPSQDLANPLGIGGPVLHEWALATNTFRNLHRGDGGDKSGVDDEFAARGFRNIGAWVMGRNMFGPSRGPWKDLKWKGWWGDNPPYHTDVFVLTHHERPPLEMEGGTSFYFVTDGIQVALKKAIDSAKGKDVRIGGGVETVREYLKAGLVDEMHLAIAPALLGKGEPLFSGMDLPKMGFRCTEYVPSAKVMHVVLTRSQSRSQASKSRRQNC